MSFSMVCHNCGAPSGPSVGMCPFCKCVLSDPKVKENSTLTQLKKLYADGQLDKALFLADKMYKTENHKTNASFLLLFSKILVEAEGPAAKTRHVLSDAFALEPDNSECSDYLELIDAKFRLESNVENDLGEQSLKNIIRRSPQNVHALFLLGSHMFWADGNTIQSVKLLERCVSLHPKFLRAWACLGAIFRKTGHGAAANRCFQQCLKLEPNPSMKRYFQSECEKLRAA
jgi:tetratricopeptide (TPR) repeat protein